MSLKRAIVLNSKDNVGVAVENIKKGNMVNLEVVQGNNFSLLAVEDIPFGFKIALRDIPKGAEVIKHGEIMGSATAQIKAGSMVHVHNVQGKRAQKEV
ncbi:MAG: UxaA family hydrolase [Thermodesulfobacteriota bacterium]